MLWICKSRSQPVRKQGLMASTLHLHIDKDFQKVDFGSCQWEVRTEERFIIKVLWICKSRSQTVRKQGLMASMLH